MMNEDTTNRQTANQGAVGPGGVDDETLILHYYGEGLDDEARARVEAGLEKDAALRGRYRELRASLDRFNDLPPARAPEHLAARLRATVERAAAREQLVRQPARAGWHMPSFAWGALAATLVVAVLYVAGGPPSSGVAPGRDVEARLPPAAGAGESPAATPAYFSRGLTVHLRDSRREILRLPAGDATDRRMLLMDILRQNRLFERVARENDADDVARVLRALEPVLLRLATEDPGSPDAEALKAKLAFELNVMLTKMTRRESDDSQSI